ncbi:hypothetical protein C3L33_13989, partial [Rhododendron williamsianum]
MKRDGRVTGDWTTYSNIASIYTDAGLFGKAENALKELEKKNACRHLSAFQFLITLYGRTGNLLEVYRVLVNLKDLPGAEKCFREWESGCSTYDIRVANVLIRAYAKDGLLEKAEELKERARRRGAKPNAKTWEIFLDYYLKSGEIKSAVDCVIMRFLLENKDVEGVEGFVEILKKAVDEVGLEIFESLIRTYAAAGKTSPIMRRRLKMENVELSEGSMKLLDVVCAE